MFSTTPSSLGIHLSECCYSLSFPFNPFLDNFWVVHNSLHLFILPSLICLFIPIIFDIHIVVSLFHTSFVPSFFPGLVMIILFAWLVGLLTTILFIYSTSHPIFTHSFLFCVVVLFHSSLVPSFFSALVIIILFAWLSVCSLAPFFSRTITYSFIYFPIRSVLISHPKHLEHKTLVNQHQITLFITKHSF